MHEHALLSAWPPPLRARARTGREAAAPGREVPAAATPGQEVPVAAAPGREVPAAAAPGREVPAAAPGREVPATVPGQEVPAAAERASTDQLGSRRTHRLGRPPHRLGGCRRTGQAHRREHQSRRALGGSRHHRELPRLWLCSAPSFCMCAHSRCRSLSASSTITVGLSTSRLPFLAWLAWFVVQVEAKREGASRTNRE
jgi:hypothetical protein